MHSTRTLKQYTYLISVKRAYTDRHLRWDKNDGRENYSATSDTDWGRLLTYKTSDSG